MQSPSWLGSAVVLAGVFVGTAHAQGAAPATAEPAQAIHHAARAHSLEQLAAMSWAELEQLYRESGPGAIPVGYARGLPIYCQDAPLGAARSRVTHWLWHGKHFSACDGTLVNQW